MHPHPHSHWERMDNNVFRCCNDCDQTLELDTVATTLPASPALANQMDPEEARAWAGETQR